MHIHKLYYTDFIYMYNIYICKLSKYYIFIVNKSISVYMKL